MNRWNRSIARVVVLMFLAGASLTAAAQTGTNDMTFFVTSAGKGKGADLGGLEGADTHCVALAKAAGSKQTSWRAYLSTTAPGGAAGVSARERVGKGPGRTRTDSSPRPGGTPTARTGAAAPRAPPSSAITTASA